VQRTCRVALFGGPALATFLFWGYQLFLVLAASGYVLGVSQGREYAEPEWTMTEPHGDGACRSAISRSCSTRARWR
jgi:cbb3-type cytochrome oxidase subunit 1